MPPRRTRGRPSGSIGSTQSAAALHWVILSAKCGFIAPAFVISEPYDVSFEHRAISSVGFGRLGQQVREQQLGRCRIIVGLRTKWLRYRAPLGTPRE